MQLVYKSAEVRLTQMLADLRVQPSGWVAIHFHLDLLLDEYKSEYQVKIALNLINDLLKNLEGFIFLLTDNSIMVLCNKLEQLMQEKLLFQLRYLYMDDPLAYTESGLENPDFCTVYDVKHNWQAFNAVCVRYMTLLARKHKMAHQPLPSQVGELSQVPVLESPQVETPAPSTGWPEKLPPLDVPEMNVSRLALIENNLKLVDLQSAIRRQPVCAVFNDMTVKRLFDELYINITQMRRLVNSEVDFLSNRWLFRYITQILDVRMIDLVQLNPYRYLDSPVSFNFNAETLLSSRFSEFDANIPMAKKVSIVLEIPVVDAFGDMPAFSLALGEVQKLGYRVCLDGLTTRSFPAVHRDVLGVDLVKVQWNGELAADTDSPVYREFNDAVKAAGSNRVILCRCDNKKAIEFGQRLGISMFQGRFIDSVINPTSKVEN